MALGLNPGGADLSLRLALTVNQQRKPDRQSEIIYHFIRAASYEGPGSLIEDTRSGLNRQLTQLFLSRPNRNVPLVLLFVSLSESIVVGAVGMWESRQQFPRDGGKGGKPVVAMRTLFAVR